MSLRIDVIWPEIYEGTKRDVKHSYVVGWKIQTHLICVAAVVPTSKYEYAVLKDEVKTLSKQYILPQNEYDNSSTSLMILGEIMPQSATESDKKIDTTRALWLEMMWSPDHFRPVVLRVWEKGSMLSVINSHIILYDAYFTKNKRYRHLTIRKRQRDNDSGSPTPLQSAIAHLNHSFDVKLALGKENAYPSYTTNLQAIISWPFVIGFTLSRPFFRLCTWLLGVHFPAQIPLVGGKEVKSFSLFLRLLNRRLDMLASIPEQYVIYNREYYSDAPFHALENGYAEFMSDIALLLLDLGAGFAYRNVVPSAIAYFQRSSHSHFHILKAQVTWLVDAPAGFKINVALASSLGKGIHLMVDVAQYAIDGLSPYVDTIILIASTASLLGLTVQLGLLYDFVEFVTLQTYYLYLYFSKLHRVQFDLLSSLWRLFLGKKKNLLRNRVDSCEYDVTQLLVGTLLFTIVFFVVATNSVFYLYFCLVRCIVLGIQTSLWCAIVFSHMIPLYSISLWLQDKYQFPADVYLQPIRMSTALSIVFPNVHKNNCFVQDDFNETNEPKSNTTIPTAYFTLHPVAISFGALFTRVADYKVALAKHYTVGKFLRCFLLGEYIPALPFEASSLRHSTSTTMSYMSTKQVWETLRACRWK